MLRTRFKSAIIGTGNNRGKVWKKEVGGFRWIVEAVRRLALEKSELCFDIQLVFVYRHTTLGEIKGFQPVLIVFEFIAIWFVTNRVDPRTDPCGTPNCIIDGGDSNSPIRTDCVLAERYEENQASAPSATPQRFDRRSRSI